MFNESKLSAFVRDAILSLTPEELEQRFDNKGISNASYLRHASPMAKYEPMITMLKDGRRSLNLSRSQRSRFRDRRRAVYGLYVDDLERTVERLLIEHAESGCIPLDALCREADAVRGCISQLRRHAWWHWMGIDGVRISDMVARSIAELTATLPEMLKLPDLALAPPFSQATA